MLVLPYWRLSEKACVSAFGSPGAIFQNLHTVCIMFSCRTSQQGTTGWATRTEYDNHILSTYTVNKCPLDARVAARIAGASRNISINAAGRPSWLTGVSGHRCGKTEEKHGGGGGDGAHEGLLSSFELGALVWHDSWWRHGICSNRKEQLHAVGRKVASLAGKSFSAVAPLGRTHPTVVS